MTDDRIYGKIATINSDREVTINRGAESGVEKGMRFAVRGPSTEVRDPDTNEVLGETSQIVTIVRVEEVKPKFCIARTFRKQKVLVEKGRSGGSLSGLKSYNDLFQPPRPDKFETRTETLRIDPKKSGLPVNPEDSIVQVGDEVMLILESEDLDAATMTTFR